jgi:isopropylmalate/isohomocitrate dehydrogenase-like protein
MVKKHKISVIYGDGIGPEVTQAALNILDNLNLDFEFVTCEAGLEHWKKTGKQISEETINIIRETEACLKGPVTTPPGPETFRSVAVTLRQTFDLYANIRPIKSRKGVKCLYSNLDLVIVRENTEGLYKGIEFRVNDDAVGLRVITRRGSERIARFAFELARNEKRRKVTAVHKANILKETCGLFRSVFFNVAAEYPDVKAEEMHVDAAALKLITKPYEFDVIVTTNLFGDILSDEAAGLVGGLGLVPSANIGDNFAMFEPVHGSAPIHAGKGIVNPSAMILSAALMLKYLRENEAASRVENALNKVLEEGKVVTYDLGGSAKTMEMTNEIINRLRESV